MRYLAFALSLLLAPLASAQNALETGGALPLADHALSGADGASVTLGSRVGDRGLAVVFWSDACPWVTRYADRVTALASEFGDAGVGFVLVNVDAPDRRDMAGQRYLMPYLADDGQIGRAFGVTRAPQIFLFDSNRRLVYDGTIDDSPSSANQVESAYFRDALMQVVAGEPVTVERTRAFGCPVRLD